MVRVRAAGGSAYTTADAGASGLDEKTPLLNEPGEGPFEEAQVSKRWIWPKRAAQGFVGGLKVLLAPVFISGQYLFACFRDDNGRFSFLAPLRHISRSFRGTRRKPVDSGRLTSDVSDVTEKGKRKSRRISVSQLQSRPFTRSTSIASTSTAISSDSDFDSERPPTRDHDNTTPSRHTRSQSSVSSAAEEIAPAKRSIRIKLHNEDALRQRKAKKASRGGLSKDQVSSEAANALKSPTGPVTVSSKQLTKFPRAPLPPRPLVPRRQPSYSGSGTSAVGPHQKTLIIDLDETLIHSMAKGGRYTTGHMVEVKLQQPVGAAGQIVGPQVPILYYVHKRPHCDEFLKKVCKWYNLVAFTASVQEYADPVIDWLEAERKYFVGRYYRQHCTFRNGAYIKDVAQVEPDLSKVMILDNSPMSYIFHEDNAIPIEGWISDPTDNDLLHLIPLLEGLQYVTDVRALLALRMGQPPSV
ncbi:NLI interacting factor-like phosphatase-domain-containing protein [Massariosphaeria phaeospora]|uniref:NLI interacting factor-like phosphatase-domain-containing protein n=1 Tax=Massariosphaeria phaeospora TaxID=100035 RepID=A0A7C8MM97_9PLEO|nr:NLI interacting factor-like phosphatase-domain-containing protein [Massariosphaeria phaeospora]